MIFFPLHEFLDVPIMISVTSGLESHVCMQIYDSMFMIACVSMSGIVGLCAPLSCFVLLHVVSGHVLCVLCCDLLFWAVLSCLAL